jgi:molecular chaperone DnaJ
MKSPHSTLGIHPGASRAEAKAAYRRKAMMHHPDRNLGDAGAADRFREVAEAWRMLNVPDVQHPPRGKREQPEEARGEADPSPRSTAAREPRGPERQKTGNSVAAEIRITLEEAFTGKQASVQGEELCTCPRCRGSGSLPGEHTQACPVCAGRHETLMDYLMRPGSMNCWACGGSGRIPLVVRCRTCAGQGILVVRGTVRVHVPAGADDGECMKGVLGGSIEVGVRIHIARHGRFVRQGSDLVAVRRMQTARAMKGSTVMVRGVDGRKLRLAVPPRTQPGTLLRVRGQGMPDDKGGRGDLLVRIEISGTR